MQLCTLIKSRQAKEWTVRQSRYKPPAELHEHRVYAALRGKIQSGRLPQGTRLLEVDLARNLGVSRTPVREALRRLLAEGLVEVKPNRGLIVTELSIEEILELYVVLIPLEATGARLAARHRTSFQLERLRRIQQEIEEAAVASDVNVTLKLNADFHDQVCIAARNHYLLEFARRIYDAFRRFRKTSLSYPGRMQETVTEHRAILTAIEARDEELAEKVARQHGENAMACRIAMNA